MGDYIKIADAVKVLFDDCIRYVFPTTAEPTAEFIKLDNAINLLRLYPSADVVPMERYKSMENTCVKLQKSLADVAPVVRCKDCRHAVDYYHEGDCYCSNPKWGLNYFGGSWEFYCADAERRNND